MYKEPYSDMRWRFSAEAVWRPATDVYETEDSAVVIVEIAGLRDGDFEIALTGRTLLISGERRDPAEKRAYQQMEIRYGRFRTQVYLPWAVDAGQTEALYDNGFLKVVLRKARTRRILVNNADDVDAAAGGDPDVKESEG